MLLQHFLANVFQNDPLFAPPIETENLEAQRDRAYMISRRLLEYDFLNLWREIKGRPTTVRENTAFGEITRAAAGGGNVKHFLNVQVNNQN